MRILLKNVFLFAAVLLLAASSSVMAKTPVIHLADLDQAIDALPLRNPADPLHTLTHRAEELATTNAPSEPELTALRQAITTIRLVRGIRLVNKPRTRLDDALALSK